jgi:hypothetical protein
MMRSLLVLICTFALSAGLGLAIHGCDHQDCSCPPTPPHPQPQAPLPKLEITSYDSAGNGAAIPVKPEDGTIEVTGDQVVLSYRQSGVTHRVVYDVTGPR